MFHGEAGQGLVERQNQLAVVKEGPGYIWAHAAALTGSLTGRES